MSGEAAVPDAVREAYWQAYVDNVLAEEARHLRRAGGLDMVPTDAEGPRVEALRRYLVASSETHQAVARTLIRPFTLAEIRDGVAYQEVMRTLSARLARSHD